MGGNEEQVKGKTTTEVARTGRGRAPSTAGGKGDDPSPQGRGGTEGSNRRGKRGSVTEQVSLFERVPASERLAWPDIAAILSGVVSSLSKLMGGGIVAFYAGCQMGGVTVAITFVLSFFLTYLVGKICYREGLSNNVVSLKKQTSKILNGEVYQTTVHSFTKGSDYELTLSKKYISENDNVLIIDDFLANGEAALGAIRLVEEAGAKVGGIGIVIEKSFQPGRKMLDDKGYDVYSLARIKKLGKDLIEFL